MIDASIPYVIYNTPVGENLNKAFKGNILYYLIFSDWNILFSEN